MAAQIACLNQLPRMAADSNSTYTTSFDFHCILQAKNARLLFACSCELARVYMRPSPTSRSRVHATFVSRVHATPRPMGPLGPLEDELPSIWSWEFTKWLVKLYPTLVYQGRSSSVLFQLLEAVDAENCRVFTGELDQISQVPESRLHL